MRMNKKAVSPVIAVMLLVAVAVAAVGAYFIWYKSFQAGSQKQVEEQTGTIGSKLRVTNITNDNVTFYITLKNATGYALVTDIGDDGTLDVDDTTHQADITVTIKDAEGTTEISAMVNEVAAATNAVFTSLTGIVGIDTDEEGQIEVIIAAAEMNPGATYTIIITAAGVTSTEKYTAI
jgi:flagellin-like protein